MKNRMCIVGLLLMCFMLNGLTTVQAQTKKKKKKEDLEFAEKVWLGGTINNNLQFGGGYFAFGLTPMAGYDIIPKVSIGPMLRMDYHYERLNFTRPYLRFEALDFGPGVFARVDVYRSFFAQVEYEHAFVQLPRRDNAGNIIFDNDRKALKETETQHYVYVGAGYATGDNVRYGISIHYNVLDDFNYIRIPWDYRISIRVQLK
jgi:hypothetical protein